MIRPARYRIFCDFVTAQGRNQVHDWLKEQPVKARAQINAQIQLLELLPEVRVPDVRMLSGACRGLLELRIKVEKVQYRPSGITVLGRGRSRFSLEQPRRAGGCRRPSAKLRCGGGI